LDAPEERHFGLVMPGLVPGIHVFTVSRQVKTWMAGSSPAMTNNEYGATN
jgi:hypothetical protein